MQWLGGSGHFVASAVTTRSGTTAPFASLALGHTASIEDNRTIAICNGLAHLSSYFATIAVNDPHSVNHCNILSKKSLNVFM